MGPICAGDREACAILREPTHICPRTSSNIRRPRRNLGPAGRPDLITQGGGATPIYTPTPAKAGTVRAEARIAAADPFRFHSSLRYYHLSYSANPAAGERFRLYSGRYLFPCRQPFGNGTYGSRTHCTRLALNPCPPLWPIWGLNRNGSCARSRGHREPNSGRKIVQPTDNPAVNQALATDAMPAYKARLPKRSGTSRGQAGGEPRCQKSAPPGGKNRAAGPAGRDGKRLRRGPDRGRLAASQRCGSGLSETAFQGVAAAG